MPELISRSPWYTLPSSSAPACTWIELLRRPRHRQQGVAAGGHFAQARAYDQQQVGVLHPLRQFRIDADADVAGIIRVRVVEQVLETESAARQASQFASMNRRRSAQALAFQPLPPRITSGRCACRQHRAQLCDIAGARMGHHLVVGVGVGGHRGLGEHVLGQGQHHRPFAPGHGAVKRVAQEFGHALRRDRCSRPTWPSARTCGGNRLPETPRARRSRCRTWPISRIIGVES